MVAELLRAVHWFNPLVWLACRRLRQESEHACDDVVLGQGVDGGDYAEHLLALARDARTHHVWVPAPAMARPSSLERRFTAMLTVTRNRRPLTRVRRLALVVVALAVAVPIATFAQSATVSGTILDFAGEAWEGTKIELAPVGAAKEIYVETGGALVVTDSARTADTDADGEYTITDVPPGQYTMTVRKPALKPQEVDVLITPGQAVVLDFILQLGSLEETLTIADTGKDEAPTLRTATKRSNLPAGRLVPPVKLVDLAPQYPPSMIGSGVEAEVMLDALVGADGLVKVVQVHAPMDPVTLQPIYPDSAVAALEAVRHWQYEPTRMHGVPVDVEMTINLRFRPK